MKRKDEARGKNIIKESLITTPLFIVQLEADEAAGARYDYLRTVRTGTAE